MIVKKAVILAAGNGTRFLPVTKAVPKAMLPIVDTPAVQLVAEEAIAAGIERILIVISPEHDAVRSYFEPSNKLEETLQAHNRESELRSLQRVQELASRVSFVEQPIPSGSGAAVALTEEFTAGEPFAIMNCDDIVYHPLLPAIGQLMNAYEHTAKSVLGVQRVSEQDISKYGAIAFHKEKDGLYLVEDFVEKPKAGTQPSCIASLGRYVASPEIFTKLRGLKKGVNGEYQLTDAFAALAHEDKLVACAFTGRRYDVGDRGGYLEAVCEYALRDERLSNRFSAYLHTRIEDKQ